MGIIYHTVSKRKFTTVAAPASVEPGFYSEPVEIHLSDDHGKLCMSLCRSDEHAEKYDQACERWIDETVLFIDYRRKADLAKFYRVDRKIREEFFLSHGQGEDAIPVFKTDGGSEGWVESINREPVGYLIPWNGKTNSDGDVLSDPDGRGQWIYIPFA